MVNLLTVEPLKRCTRCDERKLLDKFYVSGKQVSSTCKKCRNITDAERYRKARQKSIETSIPLTPARHAEVQEKLCSICKTIKSVSEFSISKRGPWAGRIPSRCKVCVNKWHREWEANNPEKVKVRYLGRRDQQLARAKVYYQNNRDRQLEQTKERYRKNPDPVKKRVRDWALRQYGISKLEYDEMLNRQNNCCACCGRQFGKDRLTRAAIHHDHVTDFVVDLLCIACNLAEGMLKTSTNAFRLAEYMQKNEPTLFPKHKVKSNEN